MYTSGTTGPSKGVPLPHAYTVGASRPFGGGWLDTDHEDVNYVFLPLYHQAGQWGGVLNAVIAGATAYLAPRFGASTFWEDARRVGATVAGFVGSAGAMLLAQPVRADDTDNPLREITMSPLVADVGEFERRFAVRVSTSFGSTEVGCVLVDDPSMRRGTYRARDGYEVRLVDDQDIEVDPGESGELVVRPPEPWTSIIAYHNRTAESLAIWRNGWLHTGDALRSCEDGTFEFVDRIKDCIRRRGENISSLDVEAAVLGHSRVRECAAYAVPSELGEDEVMLSVVLADPLPPAELIDYLAERMPRFMLPRFVRVADELPRTPTAKVQKAELRRLGRQGAWDREAAVHPAPTAGDRREVQ
jgi:crotonobetaine/carnitine-CoA ligase